MVFAQGSLLQSFILDESRDADPSKEIGSKVDLILVLSELNSDGTADKQK